eukprot:CAMPEP_0203727730 /NCGR_PEP_ID=MMETSP0092-20131115/11761_1 /ASSEMBLY_ACC=CAM_ASM_001090 /TAXON_ID=426623 /ORGANISM="Chaetoceros affinis, Strain CCMP159" /LENGTH=32 /DNA_ID= /DNA_START= /DNA_END= /DNA_ORIENTATION=
MGSTQLLLVDAVAVVPSSDSTAAVLTKEKEEE